MVTLTIHHWQDLARGLAEIGCARIFAFDAL